jgi:hypothetical protein
MKAAEEIPYPEEIKERGWKRELRKLLIEHGTHDVTNMMAWLWWVTPSYGGSK